MTKGITPSRQNKPIRIPITLEQKQAKKLAKLLTEDFNINLYSMGHFIWFEQHAIVFHRLEEVYLSAKEAHDQMWGKRCPECKQREREKKK